MLYKACIFGAPKCIFEQLQKNATCKNKVLGGGGGGGGGGAKSPFESQQK